jgi:FAD/FMN-containing dehydrogenase
MISTPNPSDAAHFLERLAGIIGPEHVWRDVADLSFFLTDWRGRYTGRALGLVRPGSAAEVQAIVRLCLAAGVPMVPQGGNTGLVGGATPDESGRALMIQFSRLRRIRSIDPIDGALIAEAGCTLAQIQNAAKDAGSLFPLSLASEGSCQIGGNLSTNAGGVQVLRYGTARDLTLGLEAVLPNGELWEGLKTLRKNNTGYDLKHLLIGAEGTLGMITAAALKLFPLPAFRLVCWLGLASPAAAISLLKRAQARFDAQLTAFELMCPLALHLVRKHMPDAPRLPLEAPWHVLCEFSGNREDTGLQEEVEHFLAACIEQGAAEDGIRADSTAQADTLWALREQISEAQKREGISIKHDIALPISRIAEFLERVAPLLSRTFPGIRHVAFGHLGDGNLHFNLSMPDADLNRQLLARQPEANRLVYDLVHELDGSISAEHGLGQLKRETIRRYKPPAEIAAMIAIKKALDPAGLMNPGKVL